MCDISVVCMSNMLFYNALQPNTSHTTHVIDSNDGTCICNTKLYDYFKYVRVRVLVYWYNQTQLKPLSICNWKISRSLSIFEIRCYGVFTPNDRGHTWHVTEHVPWFNLCLSKLIHHVYIVANFSHRTTPLTNVYVPYRVTSQTVHHKSHVSAKYSHGCSVWTRH